MLDLPRRTHRKSKSRMFSTFIFALYKQSFSNSFSFRLYKREKTVLLFIVMDRSVKIYPCTKPGVPLTGIIESVVTDS